MLSTTAEYTVSPKTGWGSTLSDLQIKKKQIFQLTIVCVKTVLSISGMMYIVTEIKA